MAKVRRAFIRIELVPESLEVPITVLEKDIEKSLQCAWLVEVEKVTIETTEEQA